MAEPFTENQKRELLNKAKAAGLKNTPILQKILYGGTITRNGNTVRFTGKNSHQIKKHLVAEGLSPVEGFISFEDIEKILPQALATKWESDTQKNKKGRKTTVKLYTIYKGDVRYRLVTKFNGDFLSFYSDRKSVGDVHWDNPGSASNQRSDDKIHSNNPEVNPASSKNPKNSSEGEFTENDGSKIKFSLRTDLPPQKTKIGYKVFAVFKSKPGQLFPPM